MLYHVTIFDPETDEDAGMAAHQDEYMALLMALLSIYAKATHENFMAGTFGALETFVPPNTLQSLSDYCIDLGYNIQTKTLPIHCEAPDSADA